MSKLIILIKQVTPATLLSFALLSYLSTPALAASDKPAKKNALQVEVTTIKPQEIQVWKKYSGRAVAVNRADLRPQVSGRITEIRFKDGHYINKGTILIVIDPRPYEAALKQAKATLATAKTKVILAEKEYNRAKSLVQKKAVSESLLDTRRNNFSIAKANLLGAEALVETAQINIDYAYVKAPISGKVSRAEITIGNLVQAGVNAPLLTSIVADKQIYVDFEIDEQTYIKSISQIPAEQVNKIPVKLNLSEGKNTYHGFILSFDNHIDQATGTIRGRALFENKSKQLLAGMSVSLLMGNSTAQHKKQIAISERAIGTDQDRKFVYIISPKNTAEYREVIVGPNIGGRRIILSGLKENDIVIIEGLARIRPNMPVMAKKKTLKTSQKQTKKLPK